MNENLLIPAAIRDALMRYLAQRPWQEVHEVMPHLMNLQPATEPQSYEEAKHAQRLFEDYRQQALHKGYAAIGLAIDAAPSVPPDLAGDA